MKKNLLFLTIVMLLKLSASAQTVHYVNHAATGSNNGTSWTNAFNKLQDALSASFTGDEIWIAKGRYTPEVKDSSFTLPSGVKLYGGFVGTESQKSQRDPIKNITTLSGDLSGDDDPSDINANRSDNCLHVLLAPAGVVDAGIDGFVISGGQTQGASGINDARRGGGLLAYGSVAIKNCVFRHNYGYFGGGFYPRGQTAQFSLENCLFSGNVAETGGGAYILSPNGGLIDQCRFESNTSRQSGSAVYIQQSPLAFTNGSVVDNLVNAGANNIGGAVYITESSLVMQQIDFIGNTVMANGTSGNRGGALWVNSSNAEIKQCNFTNNRSTSSGGAIHVSGSGVTTKFSECQFTNNNSTFGGAITNYNAGTNPASFLKVEYDACSFEGNTAATSGGAISNGFRVNARITNSSFDGNMARFGGAVFAQNDSTELYYADCDFINNNSSSSGGAFSNNAGIRSSILRCKFEGNSSVIGGALNISEDTLDRTNLTLSECIFNFNSSNMQGGAVNMQNADATISNNVFANNFIIEGTGAGGAFSINCVNGDNTLVKFYNNTFSQNEGPVGGGISGYTDDMTPLKIQMANNIFYQPSSTSVQVELGSPEFESLGGNLVSDNPSIFNKSTDLKDLDPGFVDLSTDDYHLKKGSPCINKGITGPEIPKKDLDLKNRDAAPDIGCYEFEGTIDTKNSENDHQWSIVNTGTEGQINLAIKSEKLGMYRFSVFATDGTVIQNYNIQKTEERQIFKLNNPGLCHGIYFGQLSYSDHSSSKAFIH